jgi:CheY-like chemotaxis protein
MPAPRPPPADGPAAGLLPAQPLRGLTLLAVEDSRFAAEALRLMCQRLGGRFRRVEGLARATGYLSSYPADAVIVDLGLPDGDGAELIAALSRRRRGPVLGMSGDPAGRAIALRAGADGFLDKPVNSLATFLAGLGALRPPGLPAPPLPPPDPLALRDDLRLALGLLTGASGQTAYATAFLASLARASGDVALARAARCAAARPATLPQLAALVERRIAACSVAFPLT